MNLNYGKLNRTEDSIELEFAPDEVVIKRKTIKEPNQFQYLEAGYKILINNPPPPKSGYEVFQEGYDETDTQIVAVYEYKRDPFAPRG